MSGAALVAHTVAAHGRDGGLDDVVGHLVDRSVGVDDDESLGLGGGQGEELLTQGGAEGVTLLLEAVLGAAAGGALLGQGGVPVEQDGQVRQEALSGPQGQIADIVGAQGAGRPLVGDRGVEVAVGQDDGTAFERYTNYFDISFFIIN